MKPVINPESIDILCDNGKREISTSHESPILDNKPKQSKWEKIKSRISDVCETLKPVADLILTLAKAASMFFRVSNYFGERRRRSFAK